MLGEGIQHLKNVGEFLRIVVGGDELVHLFRQLVPQTGTVLINVSDIGRSKSRDNTWADL